MRFIENQELREWVKESLRKTIFQKAHALAVQTGCDILVKLKDSASHIDCPLYYASDSLQEAYRKDGVKEEPGEMFVSGETGLPIFPRVDCATQSACDERTTGTESVVADDGVETNVPMQFTCDAANGSLQQTNESQSGELITQTTQDLQSNSLSNVVVKLEKIDDEEVECKMEATGDIGEQSSEDQSTFTFDNSVTFNTGQEDPGGGGDDGISVQPYPIMSPKPYQCGVCGKAFRTVQVLQKHTQTFHMRHQMGGARSRGGRGRGLYHGRPGIYRQQVSQQPRYLCVMCNRSFRSPDLLQDHMSRSHMSQATPVQLTQTQAFDPSSAQTSQAPATATLSSLQQQQQQQMVPGGTATFQSPDEATAQSDPSAFNVSAAPSTTSSTFASPTSTPVFKYQQMSAGASTSAVSLPQSTPSPSRRVTKHKNTGTVTMRTLMSAILLTKGPVSTYNAIHTNGSPVAVRRCVKSQFLRAATALHSANLGYLVRVQGSWNATNDVFIKKMPWEMKDGLDIEANSDLCSLHEYSGRFYMATPASVSQRLRNELVRQQLVKQELFVNPQGKQGASTTQK